MISIKTALVLLLPALAIAAPPARLFTKRQSATTCGSNYYSTSQVANAASAACNYVTSQTEAGGSDYPHQYEDYEGFNFPDPSPWYEFPILESGVYDGGSPGADRVVIDGNCNYQGAITHTGAAEYDDFVGCSGTS